MRTQSIHANSSITSLLVEKTHCACGPSDRGGLFGILWKAFIGKLRACSYRMIWNGGFAGRLAKADLGVGADSFRPAACTSMMVRDYGLRRTQRARGKGRQ